MKPLNSSNRPLEIAAIAILSHVHLAGAPPTLDDCDVLWHSTRPEASFWGADLGYGKMRYLPAFLLRREGALFGDSPQAFRVLPMALHGANAAFVYEITSLLMAAGTGFSPAAAIAATLFAMHPVPHHAIYGIASLSHVLELFFLLLALLSFLRALDRGNGYWRSLPAAAAAYLSQETAFLVVPVFFVALVTSGRAAERAARRGLIAHAVLASAAAAATVLFFHFGSADFGTGVRAGWHVFWHAAAYTSALLWPDPLHGQLAWNLLREMATVFGLVLLAVAAAAGIRPARVCGAFFVLSLLPYSAYASGVASRHAYVPSAPFCILFGIALVASARWLIARAGTTSVPAGGVRWPVMARALLISFGVVAATFSYLTLRAYDATERTAWSAIDEMAEGIAARYRETTPRPKRIALLDVPWRKEDQTAVWAVRRKVGAGPEIVEYSQGTPPVREEIAGVLLYRFP